MESWEIITDNLSKAGWSWGYVSAIDSCKRAKVCSYILRLDTPIEVHAPDPDYGYATARDVRELHLLLDGAAPFVGKRVTVTGTLEPRTTVHHHRAVLLEASSIRTQR
jgi:Domain of unknown function (DUF4431)